MQNYSKAKRPPKPNWGNEITIPPRSENSINENNYIFSIDNFRDASNSSLPTEPSTYLAPTEEYLQMTKRFIQNKSLPSRIRRKLKALYTKYKSTNNKREVTFVEAKTSGHDQKNRAKGRTSKEPNNAKGAEHSKKATTNGGQAPLPDQTDTPSISQDGDQSDSLSMQTYTTQEFDEEESRGSDRSTENFAIAWYGLHDFMFGRSCNPDMIKIDDVFSDFTLRDAGYDEQLKREIRKWLECRSLGNSTYLSTRRNTMETYAELQVKQQSDEESQPKSNGS